LLNRVEENRVSFEPNKPKIPRITFGGCRIAFGLLRSQTKQTLRLYTFILVQD
jgi:hypothetical protein